MIFNDPSGGRPRSDGSGGYFLDEDGNGVQNGGEEMISYEQVKAYYGSGAFKTYTLVSEMVATGEYGQLYGSDGSLISNLPVYEEQWKWTLDQQGQQRQGTAPGIWNQIVDHVNEHFVFEGTARATLGPQVTLIPTPKGIVVAPYIRGAFGLNVNIGSSVLWERKLDMKNGVSKTVLGEKATQGLGIGIQGINFEFSREVTNGSATNTGSVILFGLIGVEKNFTTGEFFIGIMPGGKWAAGAGMEGSFKAGLQY